MKKIVSGVFALFIFSFCFIIDGYAGEVQPQYGGVLRCLRATFPNVLGYPPEMGPGDNVFAMPYAERLTVWDEQGNQIPELAVKWDVNVKNKTITWHLRRGVKFHDGTPFNAEAAQWNYQLLIDNHRLTDGNMVKSVKVIDEYTLKMYLTEITSISVMNYGWAGMYSPTAFKTNGGKEWARTHAVGTGPFKLTEFKRDNFIKFTRNENYWRKGYPYLDGIEMRYIPDSRTASMMMQRKEADIWQDIDDVKSIIELQQKNLNVVWGPGYFWSILPNSKDPKSPFANKKVREAIEYAIDRPVIAKSLGFGQYEPLVQLSSSVSPAYVPGYNPRPYNPEKAKKLLAEAGYPNGFDTKILIMDMSRDAAVAIQSYLAKVGIRLAVDIADMGRYFGSVFGTGWNDLALCASGINPDATDIFIHFGPRPMTFITGTFIKSPEFLKICEKALHTYNTAGTRALLKKAIKQGTEDAMIIPLYRSAQSNVLQPYVHSDYMKIHGNTWYVYKDWMEKQ